MRRSLSLSSCLVIILVSSPQGLDGDATEPMIQELEEDREESQDPEVEFAIAGVMRECGGLDIILSMVQVRAYCRQEKSFIICRTVPC